MQTTELPPLQASRTLCNIRSALARCRYVFDSPRELVEAYFPDPIPDHLILVIQNSALKAETHPFRWVCAMYGLETPFQFSAILGAIAAFVGIWNYSIGAMVTLTQAAELLVMAGLCSLLFLGAIGMLLWYKSLDLPLWHETPLERFRGFVPEGIRERAGELQIRLPGLSWTVIHTRKDPILRANLPDGRSVFVIKW